MCCGRSELLRQLFLDHLAPGVLGEERRELDVFGDLVLGELVGAEFPDLFDGRVRSGDGDDGGGHPFPHHGVRDAVDSRFHHLRVQVDGVFHLDGIDVLAAAVDHVLLPAGHVKEAVIAQPAQVARQEPPVPEGLLRGLRVLVITSRHVGAPDGDLAHGPLRDLVHLLIDDPRLAAEAGVPDGGGVFHALLVDRSEGYGGLGEAEAVEELGVDEGLLHLPHQVRRHGRRAEADEPDRAQVIVLHVFRAEEDPVDGWGADEEIDPLLLHDLEKGLDAQGGHHHDGIPHPQAGHELFLEGHDVKEGRDDQGLSPFLSVAHAQHLHVPLQADGAVDEVALDDPHSLGLPRRPGCEEDGVDVLLASLGGRAGFVFLPEVGEGGALHRAGNEFVQFLVPRRAVDDGGHGCGEFKLVRQFGLGQAGVENDGYGADLRYGKKGRGEDVVVGEEDRHAIPLFYIAVVLQKSGQRVHTAVQIGVGEADIPARDGLAPRPGIHRFVKHLEDRLRPTGVYLDRRRADLLLLEPVCGFHSPPCFLSVTGFHREIVKTAV